ncbi:MAG: TatD family hydrolase [Rectinema sp.]
MSGVFTDSHAHLEMVAQRLGVFALDGVVAAYAAQPGALILDIGVDPGDLGRRRALVEKSLAGMAEEPGAGPARAIELPIRWAAGIWPGREALDNPKASLEALERDIGAEIDALGECGLDYHHMDAGPEAQRELFGAQIELALSHRLPLIVHSREAFQDTFALVQSCARHIPTIIHCFGYGPEEADSFLRAGCYLSFAGNITYKKSQPLRDALALVPEERLLLETDAPYMNPMPHRGKPSSSLDIERTYQVVSTLRGLDIEALRISVSSNLRRILGMSP